MVKIENFKLNLLAPVQDLGSNKVPRSKLIELNRNTAGDEREQSQNLAMEAPSQLTHLNILNQSFMIGFLSDGFEPFP